MFAITAKRNMTQENYSTVIVTMAVAHNKTDQGALKFNIFFL